LQPKGRKNNPDSEYSARILSGAGGRDCAKVGIPVCFLYLAAESYLFRMTTSERKSRKIYYTMGEVSEMFDVNPSLIRFWEQKFDILKPDKNKKGNRLFTPKDVENLKLIYHLVKENGMTLAGAAKRLRQNREGVSRDLEIIEKLEEAQTEIADFMEEKPDETMQIVADELDLDTDAVKSMYDLYDFSTEITDDDKEGFQKTADFMYESGMIDEVFDVKQLFIEK